MVQAMYSEFGLLFFIYLLSLSLEPFFIFFLPGNHISALAFCLSTQKGDTMIYDYE